MNSPLKGYLYLAIAALLLVVALPTLINMILIAIAAIFVITGLSLLKDNLRF